MTEEEMMRRARYVVIILGVASLLFGLAPNARAAGGGFGACTETESVAPLVGKPTIVGSGVIELFDFAPTTGVVSGADATLTLSYKTMTGVFRAHVGAQAFQEPEAAGCAVLAVPPTDGNGASIHSAFGLAPTAQLRLCFVIDSKKPEKILCQSIQSLDLNPVPATSHYTAAIGKLVIYIIE